MLHTLSISPWHTDMNALMRVLKEGMICCFVLMAWWLQLKAAAFLISSVPPPYPFTCCKKMLKRVGYVVKFRTVSSGLAILTSSGWR